MMVMWREQYRQYKMGAFSRVPRAFTVGHLVRRQLADAHQMGVNPGLGAEQTHGNLG